MKRSVSIVIILFALGVAACGSSPEDDVRAVASEFAVAADTGNMTKTCSLLTDKLFKDLGGDGELGCATMDGPGVWGNPDLKGLTVAGVSVDGDKATVSFDSSAVSLTMEQSDDGWRIANFAW